MAMNATENASRTAPPARRPAARVGIDRRVTVEETTRALTDGVRSVFIATRTCSPSSRFQRSVWVPVPVLWAVQSTAAGAVVGAVPSCWTTLPFSCTVV
jgi:hypothetical protein